MDESIGKLTVYFDDPFWVGVFEHIEVPIWHKPYLTIRILK